jgi:hypothetical protein
MIALSKAYPCKKGGPVLVAVDERIFTRRYYRDCMACSFCHDACCSHGVDVDLDEARALMVAPEKLRRMVGIPAHQWFTEVAVADKEFPSGRHVRTQVHDGACVFRNRKGRGCLIHAFCLEEKIDYHSLKPMVSVLFPLTFDRGVLGPSAEILDDSLVCAGTGPSCYDGVRDELLYYFGKDFVRELDGLKKG